MDSDLRVSFRSWLLPALAALVLALVLILASVLNAQRSLAALNEMADTRGRARAASLHAGHTLALFKDVESGMRGYLLTGHESHLEPRRAAVGEALVDGFDRAALDAELARRLDIAERLVAQRRQGRATAPPSRRCWPKARRAWMRSAAASPNSMPRSSARAPRPTVPTG